MKIIEITEYNLEIKKTIEYFLTLLTGKVEFISDFQLRGIISSDSSHLFFAIDDNNTYMGMLTVGMYLSPTGRKAWIEDVVVDKAFRGQGIGDNLVKFAIQFSKHQQVDSLMLTSNPTRITANSLYKKNDFEQKETNVYRINI